MPSVCNLVGPPAQRCRHTLLIDIELCTVDETRRGKKEVVPVSSMRVELKVEEPTCTLRDIGLRDTRSGEAFNGQPVNILKKKNLPILDSPSARCKLVYLFAENCVMVHVQGVAHSFSHCHYILIMRFSSLLYKQMLFRCLFLFSIQFLARAFV